MQFPVTRRAIWFVAAALLLAWAGADAQSARGAPRKVRATEVATDELTIRYASEVTVSDRNVVSLVIDIEPRPGIHVYAPGADDYRVLTLTITDPPGTRTRPVKYPPSEIFFFEPLNEYIPVYQKPFQISVPAIVGGSVAALKGRLEYQACDDKTCFVPVEVPLAWTIAR